MNELRKLAEQWRGTSDDYEELTDLRVSALDSCADELTAMLEVD